MSLSGGPAQTEPHRSLRQFRAESHGGQHMRRLHLAGRAGRTRRYRDTSRSKPITAVSAFRPGTVNSVVLGSRGVGAEHDRFRGSALQPPRAGRAAPAMRAASTSSAPPAAAPRRAEAAIPRHVLGAGPCRAPARRRGAAAQVPARLVGQHQRADALRAADLVRRKRHQIGAERIDIARDAARAPGPHRHAAAARAWTISAPRRPAGSRRSRCWPASPTPARRPPISSSSRSVEDRRRPRRDRRWSSIARPQTARPRAPRHARWPKPAAARPGAAPAESPGVSASALASVPPEVKMTLRGSAPTSARDRTARVLDQPARLRGPRHGPRTDCRSVQRRRHRRLRFRAQRRGRIPVEIDRSVIDQYSYIESTFAAASSRIRNRLCFSPRLVQKRAPRLPLAGSTCLRGPSRNLERSKQLRAPACCRQARFIRRKPRNPALRGFPRS
jgi:hypothetical protein